MANNNRFRTKKGQNILDTTLKNQPVTDLPGIGITYGARLKKKGFESALDVYNKFLELNEDRQAFISWLRSIISARSDYHPEMCYYALKQYSTQNSSTPRSARIVINNHHEIDLPIYPTNNRNEQSTNRNNTNVKPLTYFLNTPIKYQNLTDLPGINDHYGRNLKRNGFSSALDVYNKFLDFNQDRRKFISWLRNTILSGLDECAEICYYGLVEYCSLNPPTPRSARFVVNRRHGIDGTDYGIVQPTNYTNRILTFRKSAYTHTDILSPRYEPLSPSPLPRQQQSILLVKPCGKNCNTCSYIYPCSSFTSTCTMETFPINIPNDSTENFLTCQTDWVIYIIFCHICNIQYVGRTTQRLQQRMAQHISQREKGTTDLYRHFYETNHKFSNLRIIPIEKVSNDDDIVDREQFWMDRLKTLKPHGLNMKRARAR